MCIRDSFEARRGDYYDALQGVRERGDFDHWLALFLDGVRVQAADAVTRAERLIDLREQYRPRVRAVTRGAANALVDLAFEQPILKRPPRRAPAGRHPTRSPRRSATARQAWDPHRDDRWTPRSTPVASTTGTRRTARRVSQPSGVQTPSQDILEAQLFTRPPQPPPLGPDPNRHLDLIATFAKAGFNQILVHQIGPDQEGVLRFYETEVMTALQGAAS